MGPGGGGLAQMLDLVRRVDRHCIVIALEHHGASLRQLHDAVHHGCGVATVADHVTEHGELAGALLPCVVQAGVQGLHIGMNVR